MYPRIYTDMIFLVKEKYQQNIADAGCSGQNQHCDQKILCLSDGLFFHCIGRWLFNIHSKSSLLKGIIPYFGRHYQRRKPSRRSNCARRTLRQNASHRAPIKQEKVLRPETAKSAVPFSNEPLPLQTIRYESTGSGPCPRPAPAMCRHRAEPCPSQC